MSTIARESLVTQAPYTLPGFHELAAEMRRRRECGEPVGVWAVLAPYPELAADKNLVTDLACEEFSLRQAAGEAVAVESFAANFPGCGESLRELILTRQFFDQHPDLLGEGGDTLAWPRPGEMLHGFALLRELDGGSFSRVFLAREPAVGDRLVVVKVSFLDASAEAEALGNLRHPNIVPVHSVKPERPGESAWTAVCMPYHGTATLAQVIERLFARGRPRRAGDLLDAVKAVTPADVPPPDNVEAPPLHPRAAYVTGALRLGAELADAVALVHERSFCHRDIKPANVLVTPAGRPMLIDFNLSCATGSAGQSNGGTLPYMAPEQLRAMLGEPGGEVTPRADLFALGVILYELLAGRHPFGPFPEKVSHTEMARLILGRQRAGVSPLRKAGVRVSPTVARLVEACLKPDAEARPASASEVAAVLRKEITRPRWLVRIGLAAAVLLMAAPLWAVRAFAPEDHFAAAAIAYHEGRDGDALEQFNRAIERDGETARGLFGRGRVRFRMGDVAGAMFDYEKAGKLSPHGKIKASLAYCYNQPKFRAHATAVGYYEEAQAAGFDTAVVSHNLGVSFLILNKSEDARRVLTRAIELDPQLGQAYYARMRVGVLLGKAQTDAALDQALADRKKCLELLPGSAELHQDAARICAIAYQRRGVLRDEALDHVEKAIQFGRDPARLGQDSFLWQRLGKLKAFQELVAQRPVALPQPPYQILVEPVPESLELD